MEVIYEELWELVFAHDTIGSNSLGKEEYLEKRDSEMMQQYVQRCYTTDKILCFSSGNLNFDHWTKRVERYCDVAASVRQFERAPIAPYQPITKSVNKETFQTHCILGNRSFALGHPERVALALLNNILGGPYMSSRLNMSIRERNGLAYNIESGLTTYSDTGVWNIYLGCDAKYIKRCLRLIDKELEKLCNEMLSPRLLLTAQKQVEGQMLIGNQNHENVLLATDK